MKDLMLCFACDSLKRGEMHMKPGPEGNMAKTHHNTRAKPLSFKKTPCHDIEVLILYIFFGRALLCNKWSHHLTPFHLFPSRRRRRSHVSRCSPRRERRFEFGAPGSGQARRREPAGDEQEAAEHAGRTTYQKHASTEGTLRQYGEIFCCEEEEKKKKRHPYDVIIHNITSHIIC